MKSKDNKNKDASSRPHDQSHSAPNKSSKVRASQVNDESAANTEQTGFYITKDNLELLKSILVEAIEEQNSFNFKDEAASNTENHAQEQDLTLEELHQYFEVLTKRLFTLRKKVDLSSPCAKMLKQDFKSFYPLFKGCWSLYGENKLAVLQKVHYIVEFQPEHEDVSYLNDFIDLLPDPLPEERWDFPEHIKFLMQLYNKYQDLLLAIAFPKDLEKVEQDYGLSITEEEALRYQEQLNIFMNLMGIVGYIYLFRHLHHWGSEEKLLDIESFMQELLRNSQQLDPSQLHRSYYYPKDRKPGRPLVSFQITNENFSLIRVISLASMLQQHYGFCLIVMPSEYTELCQHCQGGKYDFSKKSEILLRIFHLVLEIAKCTQIPELLHFTDEIQSYLDYSPTIVLG